MRPSEFGAIICRRSAAFLIFSCPNPGAHAPGYEYAAAPRLGIGAPIKFGLLLLSAEGATDM